MTKQTHKVALLLAACVLLPASAALAESPERTPMAKVNGDVITRLQFDNELNRRRAAMAGRWQTLDEHIVIDELIDQRIMARQAIFSGLNEDPRVQQAMEAAKLDVLAKAYAEVAAPPYEPTEDQIRAYFHGHPNLFRKRRIYRVDELALQSHDYDETALGKAIQKSNSLMDLSDRYPDLRRIKTTYNSYTQAAEGVSLDLLDTLASKKDGAIFEFIQPSGNVSVYHLIASKESPVALSVAAPAIRQFLIVEKRKAWLKEHLIKLREKADVTVN